MANSKDKDKKKLLSTRMHQLGLGGAFNNWFFTPSSMKSDQVLTLTEFMALNPKIKTNNELFICWNNETQSLVRSGFVKESKSWDNLKTFLIKKGFNQNDWILLLPTIKTGRGSFPNFKLLDKKVLVQLPIHKVTETKASCGPFQKIGYFAFGEDWDNSTTEIKVADVLRFTPEKIELQFSVAGYYGFDKTVRHSLFGIQNKLREYGFTEKDGPFMKIFFGLVKTDDSYIAELVQNKGFSKNDAKKAVQFGRKAGWI